MLFSFAYEAAGVAKTPGIPCALSAQTPGVCRVFEGKFVHDSGAGIAPREGGGVFKCDVETYPLVMVGLVRAIHIFSESCK
jgi:hypothetical protein